MTGYKYNRILLLCVTFSACSAMTYAHGLVIYVSTPISPPAGLGWVFPMALSLLFLANVVVFRSKYSWSWLRSALLALAVILVFFLSFVFIGIVGAGFTTAPHPSLGPPSRVLYGLGRGESISLFVFWNAIGLVSLALALLVIARPLRPGRKPRLVFGMNLVLYLTCLIPFVAQSALLHGWGGFYVSQRCSDRLRMLSEACARYAQHHDGNLPAGKTFDIVFKAIQPYVDKECRTEVSTCRLGEIYERRPKRYTWNPAYSGRSVRLFADTRMMENNPPFTCPYHGKKTAQWAQWDFCRMVNEMAKSAESNDIEMKH